MITMEGSDSADDATRRTLLRTLAATGLAGVGVVTATGSSLAQSSEQGQGRGPGQGKGRGQGRGRGEGRCQLDGNFKKIKRDIKRDGTIVDDCEAVTKPDIGDEVTFTGRITVTAINLTDDDELTLSGRLKGKLTGDQSEKVDVRFDDVSLGGLRRIFRVYPTTDPEDCPLVELDISQLFDEVLGLEIDTETVEIDIVELFGEENLISDLLCSVARRFSP